MDQISIIVADKDQNFKDQVSQVASKYNLSTHFTDKGRDVVALAKDKRPEIVLLSSELDDINGFLVCKYLREADDLAELKVVLSSAKEDAFKTFENHKTLSSKADLYLKKPVKEKVLVSAFDTLLGTNYSDDFVNSQFESIQKLEAEINRLRRDNNELLLELQQNSGKTDFSSNEADSANSQLLASLRKEIAKTKDELDKVLQDKGLPNASSESERVDSLMIEKNKLQEKLQDTIEDKRRAEKDLDKLREENDNILYELQQNKIELDTIQSKENYSKKSLTGLESQIQSLKLEVVEKNDLLDQRNRKIKNLQSDMEVETDKYRNEIKALKDFISSLNKEKDDDEKRLENFQKEIMDLNEEKGRLSKLKYELDKKEDELNDTLKDRNKLLKTNEMLQEELTILQASKLKFDTILEDRNKLRKEKDSLKIKYESLENENENLNQVVEELKKSTTERLEELLYEKSEITNRYYNIEKTFDELRRENENLVDEIQSRDNEFSTINEKIREYDNRYEDMLAKYEKLKISKEELGRKTDRISLELKHCSDKERKYTLMIANFRNVLADLLKGKENVDYMSLGLSASSKINAYSPFEQASDEDFSVEDELEKNINEMLEDSRVRKNKYSRPSYGYKPNRQAVNINPNIDEDSQALEKFAKEREKILDKINNVKSNMNKIPRKDHNKESNKKKLSDNFKDFID
ncbi:MAG: response regulator [Pseudomonadota bacterium]